ncbi:MAG: FAD-binding oxidoreductase [Pseudomonadales bacterium]
MADSAGDSLIVVGAGIVGASTALALQRDGHRVLLIDREGPAAGASFGNAGGVVDGSAAPTAMPDIVFDVLRMVGRPLSPLTIRPSYLATALPWLLRFIRESRRARVLQNALDLHALSRFAAFGWRSLTDNTPQSRLLRDVGWLKVYETETAFRRTAHTRYLMDKVGADYEVLNPDQIRDLEPGLAPLFARAIFQRGSLHVRNPGQMVRGMVERFVSNGGRFERFDLQRIDCQCGAIRLHGPAGVLQGGKVVIAAGAWSGQLARQVGDRVPLESERGYHLMLTGQASDRLSRPVMNGERSFVLSPMDMGLRLTSQVEFAGLDAEPDYRRVRSLVDQARRMLPGLPVAEHSVWMGRRPSLPDSLPVLGYSRCTDRVVYAFGHQHLGMTLGPISGLVIADLLAGRKPGVDLHPYRVTRF